MQKVHVTAIKSAFPLLTIRTLFIECNAPDKLGCMFACYSEPSFCALSADPHLLHITTMHKKSCYKFLYWRKAILQLMWVSLEHGSSVSWHRPCLTCARKRSNMWTWQWVALAIAPGRITWEHQKNISTFAIAPRIWRIYRQRPPASYLHLGIEDKRAKPLEGDVRRTSWLTQFLSQSYGPGLKKYASRLHLIRTR